MSNNLPYWVFNYGNKEVEVKGTKEALQHTANDVGNISNDEILVKERVSELPPTSIVHVSIPLPQSLVGLSTPFLSSEASVPLTTTLTNVHEKLILSSFTTISSDLSPPIILSSKIQGSIAPTTVQTPTIRIPTMTNVSTLVPGISNLQPPQGKHQGILRNERPIPQTKFGVDQGNKYSSLRTWVLSCR